MPKARLVFDGDNIYTEKDARIYKLKNDISTKIDGIPWVINDLDSTSTTDALSANMGRTLQDQINSLSWTWKFLSTWNCTTWLPGTNPQEDPYTYKIGDYYVVSATGSTNYKPHWGTYTQWVPSTTVELENVWVNDKYYFDWADWVRIPDTAIQIWIDTALSTTSTNAVENRAIATAINTKQNTIADLNTIRSGAAAWATALQKLDNISELTNNMGYQTAGDVASAVSGAINDSKYVGPAAPSSATAWMLWYDTTNNILKVYNWTSWNPVDTDTTYSAWTYLTLTWTTFDVDTSTIATKSYVDSEVAESISSWSTAPANPVEWQIWYDTTNHILKIYDWTNWDAVDTNTTYSAWTYLTLTWTTFDVDTSSIATKTYVDTAADSKVHTGWTAPANPTEGMIWYDTTNDILKTYDWSQWNEVWAWHWDMLYSDFNFQAKTWNTITLDLASTVEPSANFTVNAPSAIKDWQMYILRVISWATAYTMTLWSNITNPYTADLALTANGVDQFVFLAIGWKLELQPDIYKILWNINTLLANI